jgi:outer membrane protein, multidrug efflux system
MKINTTHRFPSPGTPLLGALLAGLFVASCAAVGPDYVPPEYDVPDSWDVDLPEGILVGEDEFPQWWTRLDDPVLSALIERATAGSLDLRAAVYRIDEARARLGVERGARVPRVDVSGGYARSRQSSEATLGGKTLGDVFSVSDVDMYSAGVGATWEIDLFGRVRRSVESARAGWEASVEDYRGVLVTLRADIALVYIEVRALQSRIAIAESNVAIQQQSRELVRLRHAAGTAPGLDRALAEANVATTEAGLPPLRSQLRLAINRLSVLSGEQPGSLRAELAAGPPIPSPSTPLLVGIPADLLRQRPDIRRAERLLAAQTARVGVATADLYPSLSLGGTFGYIAQSPSDLLQSSSRTFSVGPSLVGNLFAGGRVRSAIEGEDARVQQALVAYEQTVLRALEDVEATLTSYGFERERNDSLRLAVETYREAVGFADDLYRGGKTDFQTVLDAQRSLRVFEDQLATSDAAQVAHLVGMYRAMGGGWEVPGRGEDSALEDTATQQDD